MTSNFVSVTKEDHIDWDDLGPQVVEALQEHFTEAG